MSELNNKKYTLLVVGVSIVTTILTTVLMIILLNTTVAGNLMKNAGLENAVILIGDDASSYKEEKGLVDEKTMFEQTIANYDAEIKSLYESNPGDWKIGPDGNPIVPRGIQIDIDAVKAKRDAFIKENSL